MYVYFYFYLSRGPAVLSSEILAFLWISVLMSVCPMAVVWMSVCQYGCLCLSRCVLVCMDVWMCICLNFCPSGCVSVSISGFLS